MDREQAHNLVDKLFDMAQGVPEEDHAVKAEVADEPARDLPEGKRAVRTKGSGDRVFLLDDVKKTRQWVTNPDILEGLGFKMNDVVEVDDNEMLKYQMGPALYRVPGKVDA